MLANGTDELRGQLGRARGLLAGSGGGALSEESELGADVGGLGRLGAPVLAS
jgi:hypothetical protein